MSLLGDLVGSSFSFGRKGLKGVLTTAEASERAELTRTIVIISSVEHEVFFFADDHCFGYKVLPESFVPSTMTYPMWVVPRKEVPTGRLDTAQLYIDIFCDEQRQINSIEELVELLEPTQVVSSLLTAQGVKISSRAYDGSPHTFWWVQDFKGSYAVGKERDSWEAAHNDAIQEFS